MALDSPWQDLQTTFSTELDERVGALGSLSVVLEQAQGGESGRVETLGALFREAHSLKGAARAVDVKTVERLANAVESALNAAQRSGAQPSAPWFEALYRAIDLIIPLYRCTLDRGGALPSDYASVLEGLSVEPSESEPRPRVTLVVPGAENQTPPLSSPGPAETIAVPKITTVERHPVSEAPSTNRGEAVRPSPTSNTVRVALGKLDTLLALAGELSVAQIRIKERLRDVRGLRQSIDDLRREWRGTHAYRTSLRRTATNVVPLDRTTAQHLEALLRFVERADQHTRALFQQAETAAARLAQETARLELVSRDIEAEVMAVRLVPVTSVFGPLERLVRDLAHDQSKVVQLVLEGCDTELDRKLLEQLRDPLMHMLRNAVDHGIESPDRRQACGKPRTGRIRLSASQRGGVVAITIEDDGAGLDPRHILQSAIQKGLLSEEQAASIDERSMIDLIFRPGFSTRTTVTETSGRGVGMDVVREHVESLNGQIRVEGSVGRGSSFTILIPLTLATTRAILVEQGGQLFGIPSATVERTARIRENQFVSLDGNRTLQVERHPVPAIELADLLRKRSADGTALGPQRWRSYFVVGQLEHRVAVLVDRLVGEQEVMIKSLGWPLRRVPNVSGAALLGSGQIVVVLSPADLLEAAWKVLRLGRKRTQTDLGGTHIQPPERRRHRLLVVDDSLTARTLERGILEAAGYDVVVAADGMEALSILQTEPIDLVVSDVDMPRLDGFGLTAELRRDEKLRATPVVLVTSLEAREHRERGAAAGADAYIVKSGFDQGQFLDTIGRLL